MIPIFKPILPTATQLLPHLSSMDKSRIYSNFGPLNSILVDRISNHFNVDPDCVTTINNATSGITLALLALNSNKKYCLLPSWTFSATAHAVVSAGLTPFLLDVDPQTNQLNPENVLSTIALLEGDVAAIIPVQPFGSPIDNVTWLELSKATRIPIIIDSAAAFDTIVPSELISVVSMHSTKLLPAGEGGFVISTNKKIIAEIKQRSNFGFSDSRISNVFGLNAKMSEYHAAVGLSSLDNFYSTRKNYLNIANAYSEKIDSKVAIMQKDFGVSWISTSLTIELLKNTAHYCAKHLNSNGIDTRMWYSEGLHKQKAFIDIPRQKNLEVTDYLGRMTIGIPFFQDLDHESIEIISILINNQ